MHVAFLMAGAENKKVMKQNRKIKLKWRPLRVRSCCRPGGVTAEAGGWVEGRCGGGRPCSDTPERGLGENAGTHLAAAVGETGLLSLHLPGHNQQKL